MQSDQSNWNSTPGPVSIGTATGGVDPRDGPRTVRRKRVNVGYDASNPSGSSTRKIDVACNAGFCANNPAILTRHRSSISCSSIDAARFAGGPPAFSHADTVAG